MTVEVELPEVELLQTPGGLELLVIALILGVILFILGVVGYLFYRLVISPPKPERERPSATLSPELRRVVDWAVVAVLAAVGVATTAAGALLVSLADRDRIAELVEDETIESDVLSDETLIDATHALLSWGGAGIIFTGVVILLGAVVFAGYRRRYDRRLAADPEARPSTASNALLGAVISVVASVVPFSAVLGGGVAGYLQEENAMSGLRAGAFSGVLLSIPLAIFLTALALGLAVAGTVLGGVGILAALLVSVVTTVAMTALGGYIGGYLFAS